VHVIKLIILFILTGCGYTLQRGEVSLGGVSAGSEKAQKIFIPVVDNMSVRAGPEVPLTTALRETLSAAPGVDVVDDPSKADFILLGSIVLYDRLPGPTTFVITNGQRIAGDIRIKLMVKMKLLEIVDRDNSKSTTPRKIVWDRDFSTESLIESSRRQLAEGSSFDAGSSSAVWINDAREKLQLRSLSQTLARQVVDQVVQDF